MFDIHTHILFDVDDGSDSLNTSIKMIEKEVSDGVTDIILTPHFNTRSKTFSKEKILNNFDRLINEIKVRNIKVNLYLGYEIYFKEGMTKDVKDYTINDGKYVLVEFSTVNTTDIEELVYDLISNGYKPIIAHVERYHSYLSIDDYINIKGTGAFLQVNAATIIGKHGFKLKRIANKLIKLDLIDFIASDMHNLQDRTSYLKESFNYIIKKYGKEKADILFKENQQQIVR
jgi:protein-tyrosine phosphatase